MQVFIDFLVNNYLWFLGISLVLIFALIGYLVDTSEKKEKEENMIEEEEANPVNKENIIYERNIEDYSNNEPKTEVLDDLEQIK
jgi:predicted membrane protein